MLALEHSVTLFFLAHVPYRKRGKLLHLDPKEACANCWAVNGVLADGKPCDSTVRPLDSAASESTARAKCAMAFG